MTVPLYNLTDTWNNGATVFTALKLNVTNTASAAGSLLMDVQIGGTSLFTMIPADSNNNQFFALPQGGNNWGLGVHNAAGIVFMSIMNQNGLGYNAGISPGSATISSSDSYGWSSGNINAGGASLDTRMFRDAAGIVAQRNGVNAQTLRTYNTFTDASNYERGVFDWQFTSNVFRIGTEKAGTGSTRNILFQIGGTNKLDYGVTTAAYWTTPDDFKARLLQTQGFTVATLPAAGTAGRMAYVTDALAPSFLASVVGGGAIITPVFDNGTNWVGA